jgi:hypothetical protein
MNAVSKSRVRSIASLIGSSYLIFAAVAGPQSASAHDETGKKAAARTVSVSLSEWKVELTPNRIPPGPVVLEVKNTGTIPHGFEVEGGKVEQRTPQIQPGGTATLKVDLRAGSYEAYCPIGKGSHKMLGMMNHLTVGSGKHTAAVHVNHDDDDEKQGAGNEMAMGPEMTMEHDKEEDEEYGTKAKLIKLTGGGPVIQILPGPFPFADSAAAVISMRPADQQADLNHKAQMGPYSNNVAAISGDISLVAIDRGATGDSVLGTAQFTAKDGARWKVVMDRVQTKDIPFNPRFGGVIMGLFYHGASGVHTPLVPTIQSTVALWAFAHLYKNDQLVTDNAMVHIMLLSRTRRPSDWALDCWDCSDRTIEELQLQVTPAPNTTPFDSPGGFLFVNWEKSDGLRASL